MTVVAASSLVPARLAPLAPYLVALALSGSLALQAKLFPFRAPALELPPAVDEVGAAPQQSMAPPSVVADGVSAPPLPVDSGLAPPTAMAETSAALSGAGGAIAAPARRGIGGGRSAVATRQGIIATQALAHPALAPPHASRTAAKPSPAAKPGAALHGPLSSGQGMPPGLHPALGGPAPLRGVLGGQPERASRSAPRLDGATLLPR